MQQRSQQKLCPAFFRAIPSLPPLFKAACLSTVLSLALSSGVHAERADRDRPLSLEGDEAQGNSDNQTYLLKGNVVITKGTLLVRADAADIREDPQGFQFAIATAAAGKQVYYKQKRDALAGQPEEFIEATSDKMEYDGKLDTVKLTGNAVLKRLKGGKPADESVGSVITINNLTGEFNVAGGAVVTPENPKGRAQFILAPRNASPNAAATPEPKPDPAKLKPSSTVSSAPK
jgi:lipopolysaccharide export system protein LptA